MKQNPLYTWLTPLLTALLTIAGGLLLMPEEPTALYWVNLVYILLLEGLFFGWFYVGRWRNTQTDRFSVFLGIHALGYIAVAVLWILVYSLLLADHVSLRIYLLIIGLLTVVWLIIMAIIGRQDSAYNSRQTELEDTTQDQRDLVAELRTMAEANTTPDNAQQWKRLIREAESIPPRQLERHRDRLMAKANALIIKQ